MRLQDIEFSPRIELKQHPRYAEFNRLIGRRDFVAYREVFERSWAETSILCGENIRLEELAVTAELPPSSPLVNLLGVNTHAPRRVRLAREFFDEYERVGREVFLKRRAYQTAYVQDMLETVETRLSGKQGIRRYLARRKQTGEVRTKIVRFLNLYENMKQFGTLVGQAWNQQTTPVPLRPADLPWAIDYCGYIKLRDGAHRRAVAHYLDWPGVPTLVFKFDQTSDESLAQAHTYIRDNFAWFDQIIRSYAQLDAPGVSI